MRRLSEPMLTTREVARRLKLHPTTVARWRISGGGPVYSRSVRAIAIQRAIWNAG